jgi:hypothetical protein
LYFSFHSAGGATHAFQSADKNHKGRGRGFAFDKESLDTCTLLSKPDDASFGGVQRNTKKGNKQESENYTAHGQNYLRNPWRCHYNARP